MIIIHLVILIIIQINYVLTLPLLINCTDCGVLSFLLNKSRTNALSIQEDDVSELNRSSSNIRMCEENRFY